MGSNRSRTVARVIAVGLIGLHISACTQSHNESLRDRDGNTYTAILMPDTKLWMADNLNLNLPGSYCYDDQEQNCKLYGRLYTWQLAGEACSKLGGGWRLPASEEWQRMADAFGDTKNAYQALIVGGSAKFNVVFGGRRDPKGGPYARKDAHGFYWTSSEIDSNNAWLYNLGTGGQMVTRHEGEKDHSISARCIRDSQLKK